MSPILFQSIWFNSLCKWFAQWNIMPFKATFFSTYMRYDHSIEVKIIEIKAFKIVSNYLNDPNRDLYPLNILCVVFCLHIEWILNPTLERFRPHSIGFLAYKITGFYLSWRKFVWNISCSPELRSSNLCLSSIFSEAH